MSGSLRLGVLAGAFTVGVGATVSLNACANFTSNIPQYATDAADIAAGLTHVVHDLELAKVIPAGTAVQVNAALVEANAAAGDVAKAPNATAATNPVGTLARDTNIILGAISSAPNVSLTDQEIAQAAGALLPVLEASVGIVVPAGMPEAHETAAQARDILVPYAR